MGTNNSKDIQRLTSITVDSNNNNQTWQSTISKKKPPLFIHPALIYHGWQEIYRCSHTDWLHQIPGRSSSFSTSFDIELSSLSLLVLDRFGFTRHKFTCTSELHSICAPGFCSESLSRKLHHSSSRISSKKYGSSTAGSSRSFYSSSSKSKKLREHFEYNHIPAMISSLQNYSVHGIVNGCSLAGGDFEDTIMLLIYSVILEKSKFIIVDLKLNRFVCALGDDYHGLIDVWRVHSAWSRDRTQVIIRLFLQDGSTALDFYQSNQESDIDGDCIDLLF